MTNFFLPFVFVVLWSSAFVSAKTGLEHATPFAFLAIRFFLVAFIFLLFAGIIQLWLKFINKTSFDKNRNPTKDPIILTAVVGLLLHGLYLGSCFYAISIGLGAALTALVVSMQPLLTTGLAVIVFNEKPRPIQWAGIFTGFFGVFIVLSPSLGATIPPLAIMSSMVGLISITLGTLLQKRTGNSIDLLKSNIIQSTAATLFFMALVITIETPKVDIKPEFVLALTWQVLAVSTGAYVLLMILIKKNSVARTTSLMFLVPPVTAIIAFLVLKEPITSTTLFGFFMASTGVYLVTKYESK